MKPERIVTYLLVMPLILTLLSVLMLSSWTIERFHLKKQVPKVKGDVQPSD